jgi:hypothetical protein
MARDLIRTGYVGQCWICVDLSNFGSLTLRNKCVDLTQYLKWRTAIIIVGRINVIIAIENNLSYRRMAESVVLKVGGVNPSATAAVVNPTPESEMDALLLGRTGVSDPTRHSVRPHVTLTLIWRVFMNGVIDLDYLYDNAPRMVIAWKRRGFVITSLCCLYLRLCL